MTVHFKDGSQQQNFKDAETDKDDAKGFIVFRRGDESMIAKVAKDTIRWIEYAKKPLAN